VKRRARPTRVAPRKAPRRGPWRAGLLLSAGGTLAALVVLEAGLRLGGLLLLRWTAPPAPTRKADVRVLCLGESTTRYAGRRDSYPLQLEGILNAAGTGLTFEVVNGGMPGVNSAHILSGLEVELDRVRPDVVVTMIGINDRADTPVMRGATSRRPLLVLSGWRVPKLARYVADGLRRRFAPPRRTGAEPSEEAGLKEAVAYEPEAVRPKLKLSWFYRMRGRPAEAKGVLDGLIDAGTVDASLLLEAGAVHRALGDLASAEDFCRRALSAGAGEAAVTSLASVQRQRGRADAALRTLRRAVAAGTDSVQIRLLLADLHRVVGRKNEARRLLEESLAMWPDQEQPYVELSALLESMDRRDLGFEVAERGLARFPSNPRLAQRAAVLAASRGDFESARAIIREAIDRDPFEATNIACAGDILEMRGFLWPAALEYGRAAALAVDPAPIRLKQARALREAGRFDSSREVLRDAVRASPDSVPLRLELAGLEQREGAASTAAGLCEEGLRLDGLSDADRSALADCLRNAGSPEKAFEALAARKSEPRPGAAASPSDPVEALARAVATGGAVEPALYQRASDAAQKSGRVDAVREALRARLRAQPGDFYAAYALVDLGMHFAGNRGGAPERRFGNLARDLESLPLEEGLRDLLYGRLGLVAEQWRLYDLAERYFARAREARAASVNPATRQNYGAMKDAVLRRGLRLVCVQYPMREVGALRALLSSDERVLFVDNEASFRRRVRREGPDRYFFDLFGGDFGHCTEAGNRLLAENVARAVLEAVSRRGAMPAPPEARPPADAGPGGEAFSS
jgi:tetratricopeptide (TPR) repeat protein